MENYSYSSYNSGDSSSPRSREIDCSWDDQPPPNYKVKFMVSYNGKIHPRPHDNNLSYMGGDTKILAVDRHVKFQTLLAKLSALVGNSSDVCFKYQLPGEDLDALITVTNDEDLEHMMLEYDRMCRGVGGSFRPARLRLFLFLLGGGDGGGSGDSNTASFVEGLNSGVQQQQGNPDYLFGLDKVKDGVVGLKEGVTTGSDCGSDAVASPTEIQRQINELQRLQISGQLVRKVSGEGNVNSRVGFGGEEFFGQSLPEKVVTPPAPAPVGMHPGFVQERHGNFQVAAGLGPVGGGDRSLYLIPAGAAHGVYQAAPPPPGMQPVAGHPGQGYYGMQRVVQEVYREQPVYGQVPSMQQQGQGQGQKMATGYGEGMGMMHQKIEQGYVQVGYDAAGRQVYYTVPGGMAPPVYQTTGAPMAAVEGKAVGSSGAVNQDGKV